MTRAREAETKFIREQNDLEITKAKEMSGIETEKFKNMVDSIGSDTIASIANAGPEMQVGQIRMIVGFSYEHDEITYAGEEFLGGFFGGLPTVFVLRSIN